MNSAKSCKAVPGISPLPVREQNGRCRSGKTLSTAVCCCTLVLEVLFCRLAQLPRFMFWGRCNSQAAQQAVDATRSLPQIRHPQACLIAAVACLGFYRFREPQKRRAQKKRKLRCRTHQTTKLSLSQQLPSSVLMIFCSYLAVVQG